MADHIYVVIDDWDRIEGLTLAKVPILRLTEKTVEVTAGRATGYGTRLRRETCNFTAEDAMRAYEVSVVEKLEKEAASKRHALDTLRSSHDRSKP